MWNELADFFWERAGAAKDRGDYITRTNLLRFACVCGDLARGKEGWGG